MFFQKGNESRITRKSVPDKKRKVLSVTNQSAIPLQQDIIRHDTVNFLQLRKTKASKHAIERNAAKPGFEGNGKKADNLGVKATRADRIKSLEKFDSIPEFRGIDYNISYSPSDKGVVKYDGAFQDRSEVLKREKSKAQKVQKIQSNKVSNTLAEIKFSISASLLLEPSFKIWARNRYMSAWSLWINYIKLQRYHEIEQAKLEVYAIKIQKKIRMIKHRKIAKETRKAQIALETQCSIVLQAWFRGILVRKVYAKKVAIKAAVSIQAYWRGYCDRAVVKRFLKGKIRGLLRCIAPNGAMHRLREIQLTTLMHNTINRALIAVEETQVELLICNHEEDIYSPTRRKPFNSTTRELLSVIRDLPHIITQRAAEAELKKANIEKQRLEKISRKALELQKTKNVRLAATENRIRVKKEIDAMFAEDISSRECIRIEKFRKSRIEQDQCRINKALEMKEMTLMRLEDIFMKRFLESEKCFNAERQYRLQELQRINVLHAKKNVEKRKEVERLEEFAEKQKSRVELRRNNEKQVFRNQMKVLSLQQQREMECRAWEKESQKKIQLEVEREQALRIARAAEAERLKMEKRRQRSQRELESQHKERILMNKENILSNSLRSLEKKLLSGTKWETILNAEEVIIDTLGYEVKREERELFEECRREKLLMKQEDEMTQRVRTAEVRRIRLMLAKLAKDCERVFESSQRKKMELEEKFERDRIRKVQSRIEHQEILQKMRALTNEHVLMNRDKIREAKARRMMCDEEIFTKRYLREFKRLELISEAKARDLMFELEGQQRVMDAAIARITQKRLEQRRRGEMTREELRAIKWHQLESDGMKIESLLWLPIEAKMLRQMTKEYPHILRDNVSSFCELAVELSGEEFPLNVMFQTARDESRALLESDDEAKLNSKMKPALSPRSRWKWAFSKISNVDCAKKLADIGYLLLKQGNLFKGCATLRKAYSIGDKSSKILRALGRAHFQAWKNCVEDEYLQNAYFYFKLASRRLELLSSPAFLYELGLVLEASCKYKPAAELLGRIITSFPSYEKLNAVIFRAGVLMLEIKEYEKSRKYILHTMEDPPKPWKHYDILFMVARVYDLEGEKKLSVSGYETSFRTNSVQRHYDKYRSWKEWLADSETWRNLGNRYYNNRLFVLAKDAYQQALRRRKSTYGEDRKTLDSVWLKLAICHDHLRDKKASIFAMKHWLKAIIYREQVKDLMLSWDAEKWSSLGLSIPQQVLSMHSQSSDKIMVGENDVAGTEKSMQRLTTTESKVGSHDNSKLVTDIKWKEVVDEHSGEVYYWNPDTDESRWAKPK